MGYRIDSYTRDELGKISLPGRAVSTLFWVLPVGPWRPNELDRWWNHFTRTGGVCHDLGLLLVKDHGHPVAQESGQTANLRTSLAEASGGNLLEMIPEAQHHSPVHRRNRKSLLVLSGAFPQPGWGVLVPVSKQLQEPEAAEELINQVITASCDETSLDSIRIAARAYRVRQEVAQGVPRPPKSPPEIDELKRASESLHAMMAEVESATGKDLERAATTARQVIDRHLDASQRPGDGFWKDLFGRIRLIRELTVATRDGDPGLEALWNEYESRTEEERAGHLAQLHPKHAAALKKLLFLRKSWPELEVAGLEVFLATTYRLDLKVRVDTVIPAATESIDSCLKDQLGEHELALDRVRHQGAARIKRLQEAEAVLRSALNEATVAQWELGPSFLMALERKCREHGTAARSVTWDPARMVGWKLHVSQPGLKPKHLVMAVNSVLGTQITELGISPPGNEFSGSLFADYAYFTSISAKRLTPWHATRNLLLRLLNVGQLDALAGDRTDSQSLPFEGEQELAEQVLRNWGWEQPLEDATRPLAACLDGITEETASLLTSPNDTRVSFEGFLKDLCRVTIAHLGWRESEMSENLAVHCPDYRWTTRDGWFGESAKLTAGSAVVLLKDLVPLGFPGQLDSTESDELWKSCQELLKELNRGSHHPPPPPPTEDELRNYAKAITRIIQSVAKAIGEMPWHLKPTQTFGSDPTIVTGYAWSHSHPEERLIRVILPKTPEAPSDLLVWNKTLTNPVMTDAIVI